MKLKKYNIVDALEAIIDYRGRTPNKSETGIPTLSAKSVKMGYIDYDQCYFISPKEYESFMVRGFPRKGDVLVTTEAPLGVVAQLDRDDVAIAQRLLTIRGKKGVLDNAFLFYYLQSSAGQQRLIARQSGSTVMGIRQEEFRKIEIEIPSFQIQQQIASVLSNLDRKIALNRAINRNLEALAKQLYDYWFVQFDFPDENGWPYKSSGGKMVWNEVLKREVPEGWKNTTLGELCTMYQPQTIGTDKLSEKGRYRVYGANGVVGMYDKFNHENSEIAMACRGSSCGTLNRTMPYSWITGNAMVIQMKDSTINNEFIKQAIAYVNISGAITGSGQPQLTRENLSSIVCIKPTEQVLQRFSRKVEPIVQAQLHIIEENTFIAHQRDELLPLLMNGQVTIE